MAAIDASELWRQIPPEEKLTLMSKAHARGILSALFCIVVAGTLAICFRSAAIFWITLIASPVVFQFVTGKEWKDLRPRVMLEYLAARAAARRYAFIVKSQHLHLNFLFRGKLEHLPVGDEDVYIQYDSARGLEKTRDVWIALFDDAVICMSEAAGGASLEFGPLINDNLELTINASEEYAKDQEVILDYEDYRLGKKKVRLTSRYPAAFVVFLKKLEYRKENQHEFAHTVEDFLPEGLEEFAQENAVL